MQEFIAPEVNSEPNALARMASIVCEIGKTIFADRTLDQINSSKFTKDLLESELSADPKHQQMRLPP